jgi:RNA polymerase sigma-70 factor, ECF subfamily
MLHHVQGLDQRQGGAESECGNFQALCPFERFDGPVRLVKVNCEMKEQAGTRVAHSSMEGKRNAFERLTQARLDRAYRLAATILDGDAEAQDAVHDAAIQAWTRWPTLRDEGRFDAWFDRIVVNVCRDRLRRTAIGARKFVGSTSATDPTDRADRDDTLLEAIARLSPDHKIVVVLRFVEDLNIAEIARRTGQRQGTVKSRLHYALRNLRAAYDAALTSGGTDR